MPNIAHLGDTRISYYAEGAGSAVVLLPSIGRGAGDFELISALLVAQGLRVLRPEPRGVGASVGPMGGLHLSDLATDIAGVIEAEGIERAVIAGHAFGNFVARMLATSRPDLVRGVVLIAGSAGKNDAGGSPFDPEVIAAVYKCGDLTLSKEERLRNLRIAFFAEGNDPSSWLDGWFPETKAMQRQAEKATAVDEFFAAGVAPILDLQALADTVAPRHLSHIVKQNLGQRVTVREVADAGHALIAEKPAVVVAEISRWIKNLEA